MEVASFEVQGLATVCRRGSARHCTFYTLPGRQRRSLDAENKRQAERRAREMAKLIQEEDREGLATLDGRAKGKADTFAIFVREEFLPKYCVCGESTRRGEKDRLRVLCEEFGALPLSGLTAAAIAAWLDKRGGGPRG